MKQTLDKWNRTEQYKKINIISDTMLKILKILIFLFLGYAATVLYVFNYPITAFIILMVLSLYIIFSWLDALSR